MKFYALGGNVRKRELYSYETEDKRIEIVNRINNPKKLRIISEEEAAVFIEKGVNVWEVKPFKMIVCDFVTHLPICTVKIPS